MIYFQDLVLLLLTSGRDPGIIPRNTHPPEPEGFDGNVEGGAGQTPQLRLPRIKEIEVNGIPVKIKYCDTCMLYRPPRCSHCSICNNCVERFDHHCPWVGQCIGLVSNSFIRLMPSDCSANVYEMRQTHIWAFTCIICAFFQTIYMHECLHTYIHASIHW